MLFLMTLKVIIIKNKILVKTFWKMLFGGLNFFLSNMFNFFSLEVKYKAVSYIRKLEKIVDTYFLEIYVCHLLCEGSFTVKGAL